jgi:uncharacterized protein
MPGKFVVKKGTTGKFRFSLLSTNGQVVATSEAYNSKASAMNGIKADRKAAATAKKAAAKKRAAKKAAPRKAAASSGS